MTERRWSSPRALPACIIGLLNIRPRVDFLVHHVVHIEQTVVRPYSRLSVYHHITSAHVNAVGYVIRLYSMRFANSSGPA